MAGGGSAASSGNQPFIGSSQNPGTGFPGMGGLSAPTGPIPQPSITLVGSNNQQTPPMQNSAGPLSGTNYLTSQQGAITSPGGASDTSGFTNQALVNDYQQYLGRTPDQAGYNYWNQQLQSGVSPDAIAQSFQNSPEAQNRQSIMNDYSTYLNRAPDQAGFNFWMNAAQNGQSPQSIAQSFMNSPEAQKSLSGQANLAQAQGPQMTNPNLTGQGVLGNNFFFNPMTGSYQTNAGASLSTLPTTNQVTPTTTQTAAPNAFQGQSAPNVSQDQFNSYMQNYFASHPQTSQPAPSTNSNDASAGATGGLAALIARRK